MARRGATREDVGQRRMPGRFALQRSAIRSACHRLVAEQIRRADLHSRSAQLERRRHAAGIGDASSSDDRHADGTDDLRHQRESTDLRAHVIGQEHAAVPAGFHALRDDRIHSVGFEPQRLLHRCRRRQHLRAPALDARHQLRGRQAEVKAHDAWFEFGEHICSARAECNPGVFSRGWSGFDTQLLIVRRERRPPARFMLRIDSRRRVAEEVDVERRRRGRRERRQLRAHRIGVQDRAGQRPESTRIRDRRRERVSLHACHWRLDDWQIDTQHPPERIGVRFRGHSITSIEDKPHDVFPAAQ